MRVNLADVARAVAEHGDPAQAIRDAIGDYTGIEVAHNQVLVGTYVRSERTAGGIILPEKKIDEDRFQGKCALVLKLGPLAFKDDGAVKFGGFTVKEDDWVFFRTSDGWEFYLGEGQKQTGHSVRLVDDVCIKGRIPDPSMIY